jgi:peptidoglycan/LPS O-acetylase OafA/YrhL
MNAPFRPAEAVTRARLTEYRPFIDGLRAVSILAVVLYHVGVPGVSGGFVGVDVFFVISGFLIISQIVDGLERGTFSFGEFWARRALRILPPYFLVLASTMAAAAFVLVMPDELKEFGKELGYASAMGVNHFFLNQQGYFDTAADSKVLLHAWSLAVEEQFYLVAPLMLALTWWLPKWLGRGRLRQPLILWVSIALFVLSLAGCIAFTTGGRNSAFYLAVLRAWEFVAGGAIGYFLPAATRLSSRTNGAIAAAGLAAIVASALLYTSDTHYPSWRAMVPVLGAAAVILGGLASPKSAAVRLLATPPMVWIGLVSYSWYLWHWPLLALSRTANFGERNLPLDVMLAVASLGLAAATFYLIERPIRRWRRKRGKPLGWRPVFAGIALAAAVGTTGWTAFLGASDRLAAKLPPVAGPATIDRVPPICNLAVHTPEKCNAIAAGRPLGLVIGDSHAGSSLRALALYASARHSAVARLAAAGCAPMFATKVFLGDPKMAAACDDLKRKQLPLLADGSIKAEYAMIYARWPVYTNAKGYPLGPLDAEQPAADQAEAFSSGLRTTIADLKSWGVKRILVVGPTPLFKRIPANCLYLAERYGVDRAHACGVARAEAEVEPQVPRQRLAAALAGFDGSVRYLDPFGDFCDAERCLPYDGDSILFVDTNHLSDPGAERLIGRHPTEFAWLVGGGS